ncbi:hypothetical protein [Nocardiopsis dassonvillei]|uniref:hypothetical protein n=1 Tax=Nocardiopsis dassonvillei TaxID=2014 RepID=UPI00366F6C95
MDRKSYDRSKIEWDIIKRRAFQVAKQVKLPTETGNYKVRKRIEKEKPFVLKLFTPVEYEWIDEPHRVCPDYWVLKKRFHKRRIGLEEEEETTYYCLGSDGSLFTRTDEVIFEYDRRGALLDRREIWPSVEPFSDWNVTSFDFRNGNPSLWQEGVSPVFPAKGGGLIKELEGLL